MITEAHVALTPPTRTIDRSEIKAGSFISSLSIEVKEWLFEGIANG
jgi:hypothetical protein